MPTNHKVASSIPCSPLHNAGAFKECVFDSDQTVLDRVEGEKGISKGREGAIIIRMPSPSHQTSTKRCMQPSKPAPDIEIFQK